jgi:hypothetical protein
LFASWVSFLFAVLIVICIVFPAVRESLAKSNQVLVFHSEFSAHLLCSHVLQILQFGKEKQKHLLAFIQNKKQTD